MDWGNAFVQKIVKNDAGDIVSLEGELHLEGDFKKTKLKIHWLSMEGSDLVNLLLVDFDYIITKKKVRPKGISLFPRPWALLAKSSVQRERERERENMFSSRFTTVSCFRQEKQTAPLSELIKKQVSLTALNTTDVVACVHTTLFHTMCVCVLERERERERRGKSSSLLSS